MGLYKDLVEAGIETDSHESDLYFPVTEQSTAILQTYPQWTKTVERFRHSVNGTWWYDVPFAFQPWWDARQVSRCPSK